MHSLQGFFLWGVGPSGYPNRLEAFPRLDRWSRLIVGYVANDVPAKDAVAQTDKTRLFLELLG